MKIIANTKTGFLIEAEHSEVREILLAVLGTEPKEINVGQKIPAIDYASTIRKIKELENNYNFKEMCSETKKFVETVEELKEKVSSTSKIEV